MREISNLEYFKVFLFVARAGSVTEAAKELSISQPAVSQALKQLERQLGVELVNRVSRGIQLTREGQELYLYVEKSYEQLSMGVDKIRQMMNMEAGEIRIGASDMTLQYYLLPYLEKFHERYPAIKVNVTNAPTPETLKFLEEGRIDFGIVSTPFVSQPEVESVCVREIEDVFVAGRKFLPYKNRTLDLQELERLPLIFLEKNTSTRSYMDAYLKEWGVELRPEFELATSDMIVQFTLRNLGVGCVVRDFAQKYIDQGQLFELRFNHLIPKRNFCVVRNTKMMMSKAAGHLMEIMQIGTSDRMQKTQED